MDHREGHSGHQPNLLQHSRWWAGTHWSLRATALRCGRWSGRSSAALTSRSSFACSALAFKGCPVWARWHCSTSSSVDHWIVWWCLVLVMAELEAAAKFILVDSSANRSALCPFCAPLSSATPSWKHLKHSTCQRKNDGQGVCTQCGTHLWHSQPHNHTNTHLCQLYFWIIFSSDLLFSFSCYLSLTLQMVTNLTMTTNCAFILDDVVQLLQCANAANSQWSLLSY